MTQKLYIDLMAIAGKRDITGYDRDRIRDAAREIERMAGGDPYAALKKTIDSLARQGNDLRARIDNEMGARADSYASCSRRIDELDKRVNTLEGWRQHVNAGLRDTIDD